MEVGIERNVEKTKYMLKSCHQNICQIHDIQIANRLFENVSVQIFWSTVTKHGSEEYIWTEEGSSDWRLKETA
jgi:hypothetical protein